MLADFGLGVSRQETGLPFLSGKHRDFDTAWYYEVGAQISFAMIINSFSSFFGRLAHPPISMALRCWNRSWNKHLRKLNNYMEEQQENIDKEREKRKKERMDKASKEGGSLELEGGRGDDYGDEEDAPPTRGGKS